MRGAKPQQQYSTGRRRLPVQRGGAQLCAVMRHDLSICPVFNAIRDVRAGLQFFRRAGNLPQSILLYGRMMLRGILLPKVNNVR